MSRSTEQESFWEGDFGNEYTERNQGANFIASNTAFFSKVLYRTQKISSVLELGSNIGMNLMALSQLIPSARLSAVEINRTAAKQLRSALPEVELHLTSILEFKPTDTWELVFTKGVLIHINPEKLPMVYDLMYRSSSRYVLMWEYFNPKPIEIDYRGHSGKLFKRDFAGEMLDRFPGLSLIDYGFIYNRDPNFSQDNPTWFLMEKR